MKPRLARRRIRPAQDLLPPEVPEVTKAPPAEKPEADSDPIPEHIRRMLEVAYT